MTNKVNEKTESVQNDIQRSLEEEIEALLGTIKLLSQRLGGLEDNRMEFLLYLQQIIERVKKAEAMSSVVDAAEKFVRRISLSALSFEEARYLVTEVNTYQSLQASSQMANTQRRSCPECCNTCYWCADIQVGAPCVKCKDFNKWVSR